MSTDNENHQLFLKLCLMYIRKQGVTQQFAHQPIPSACAGRSCRQREVSLHSAGKTGQSQLTPWAEWWVHDGELTTHEDQVQDHLKNLKVCKAMGPNEIPWGLRELAEKVAKPGYIIFKKPWQYGEIPVGWKRINVTLISKKVKKQDLGNYIAQLVSLLCLKRSWTDPPC